MEHNKIYIKELKLQKDIEIKGLHTIFKKKFEKNHFFGGESHDFWEMVCCLSGQIGITAGNFIYTLKAGECFFHRPMEFHRLWAEGGTSPETSIITFSCNNTMKIKHGIYKIEKEEIKKLNQLLLKSEMLFEKDDIEIVGLKENMQYEFHIFINELENFILNILVKGYAGKSESPSLNAEKYTSIIKVMEENIGERLSAPQLAEMCNMSVPNLKKVFKKYSGQGVMEYFSDMKIKKAIILLKEGKSVKETSFLLGFYDQNYFNVFFKRHIGISPGKYRNK